MDQLRIYKKGLQVRLLIWLIILISILFCVTSYAQNHPKKNRRYQKDHNYKRNQNRLVKACHILERKRIYRTSAFHRTPKTNSSPMKLDHSNVVADLSETKPVVKEKPVVKPVAKPVTPVAKKLPITPKIEQVSDEKLVKLHQKEDEVLANNDLPVPTSKKHEEVRKRVSDKLASKTNVYPLILAPLYFQFNQDEFSVVDMEPFLMAAEYALQGRTVLIEGHTDSRGQDDFNVKLSIKRVQKIRQLMLDMGVPDDRISVVGYGEEMGKEQKVKNDSGHQQNRRVDFTIF